MLRIQSSDLQISTKSNHRDLVTRADLESERQITSFIRAHWPTDGIQGEEGGGHTTEGFTWIIDPVDGTVNYAHGLPLFAVSIGIALNGVPIAGLVHLPGLGNTYRAAQGKGAFRDGKAIRVSDVQTPDQALVVTGFPYDREKYLPALMSGVENILRNCRGIRRTGTAAVDLCWLAEGRFDAHYEMHLNPWDTCAGVVVVREAGGRVTDYAGKDHDLSDKTLLATNGHLHEAMLGILAPMRNLL